MNMNKAEKKCYMCEKLATSVEHIPPQCLFPEQKDLPDGIDSILAFVAELIPRSGVNRLDLRRISSLAQTILVFIRTKNKIIKIISFRMVLLPQK